MVRRLKIYFIHSGKYDYHNLFYRYILSSSECIKHELMLPLTEKYKTRYVKELLETADLIIAEVSNPNFTLKLELKWALKTGKPIKYISLTNTIKPKLKKIVPEIESITEERTMIKIIEDFINYYASMTQGEQLDPTVILGEYGENQ